MEKRKIPKTRREYLAYIADRIFAEHPSPAIILNELIEADSGGYSRGYNQRTIDGRKFKDSQETRRKTSWNTVKDSISDKCSKATIENTNENPSNE
jgi:hypothetical protein